MQTRRDVIELAFRRIGIVGEDEPATADQYASADALLRQIEAEIDAPDWSAGFPDNVSYQVAMLLGVDLAQAFSVAPKDRRGRALIRLRAVTNPDDRDEG